MASKFAGGLWAGVSPAFGRGCGPQPKAGLPGNAQGGANRHLSSHLPALHLYPFTYLIIWQNYHMSKRVRVGRGDAEDGRESERTRDTARQGGKGNASIHRLALEPRHRSLAS